MHYIGGRSTRRNRRGRHHPYQINLDSDDEDDLANLFENLNIENGFPVPRDVFDFNDLQGVNDEIYDQIFAHVEPLPLPPPPPPPPELPPILLDPPPPPLPLPPPPPE